MFIAGVTHRRASSVRSDMSPLTGLGVRRARPINIELPEVKPLVDEYWLHQLRCPDCGQATRAGLPVGVSASGYGPRREATVGLISGPDRQSERQTHQAVEDFFQVEVALGTINNLRQEVSTALAAPVAEATAFAQAQAVEGADETDWV